MSDISLYMSDMLFWLSYISVIMSIMCEIRKGHSNLWKCMNILLYHSCKCIKWIKILCQKTNVCL